MTLIVGWMQTMKYFQFIRSSSETVGKFLHAVTHDIFSFFLVLYLLILLGFGFAMHVLLLAESEPDVALRTPMYSLFMTFSAILSMEIYHRECK